MLIGDIPFANSSYLLTKKTFSTRTFKYLKNFDAKNHQGIAKHIYIQRFNLTNM